MSLTVETATRLMAERRLVDTLVIKEMVFKYVHDLNEQLSKLEPNSPAFLNLAAEYYSSLNVANDAQLAYEQARHDLLTVWEPAGDSTIADTLADLHIPVNVEPIADRPADWLPNQVKVITPEEVAEWIKAMLKKTREVGL